MTPLIELRGLTVELPTPAGWIRPVDDVSFALETGESLGLVGESGSGKSMLALALMGLLPPGARIRWRSVAGGRERLYRIACDDLLTMPERERIGVRGRDIAPPLLGADDRAQSPSCVSDHRLQKRFAPTSRGSRATKLDSPSDRGLLERAAVQKPELRARQYPHQLSGGLRQRAMIAMALAAGATVSPSEKSHGNAPRLLIADEPTTALDVTPCRNKFARSCSRNCGLDLGLALLFITHDLGVVSAGGRSNRCYVRGPHRGTRGRLAKFSNARGIPIQRSLLRCIAATRASQARTDSRDGAVADRAAPRLRISSRAARVRVPECTFGMPELRAAGFEHRARCILVAETNEKRP